MHVRVLARVGTHLPAPFAQNDLTKLYALAQDASTRPGTPTHRFRPHAAGSEDEAEGCNAGWRILLRASLRAVGLASSPTYAQLPALTAGVHTGRELQEAYGTPSKEDRT